MRLSILVRLLKVSNEKSFVKLEDPVKLDNETLQVLQSYFNIRFNGLRHQLDSFGVSLSRVRELLEKIELNTRDSSRVVVDDGVSGGVVNNFEGVNLHKVKEDKK